MRETEEDYFLIGERLFRYRLGQLQHLEDGQSVRLVQSAGTEVAWIKKISENLRAFRAVRNFISDKSVFKAMDSDELCFGHGSRPTDPDASWKQQWMGLILSTRNSTLNRVLLSLLQDDFFEWQTLASIVGYLFVFLAIVWLSWKFYYAPFVWKRVSIEVMVNLDIMFLV